MRATLTHSCSWFPTGWSQPNPVPLVVAGPDCDWIPAGEGLTGHAALVTLTRLPSTDLRAPCNYVRLMKAAASAGAAALVMVAPPGGDAAPANCTGGGPRSPINGCAGRRSAVSERVTALLSHCAGTAAALHATCQARLATFTGRPAAACLRPGPARLMQPECVQRRQG